LPEQTITVPFKGGKLTLTQQEAAQLQQDIETARSKKPGPQEALTPPSLTKDGYLTHTAFCEFFKQIHVSEAVRGRVPRIFGKLATGARSRVVSLEVRCQDCRKKVGEPCTAEPPVRHDLHFEKLEINAQSLARLSPDEIRSISGVGHVFQRDITMLQNTLKKNEA